MTQTGSLYANLTKGVLKSNVKWLILFVAARVLKQRLDANLALPTQKNLRAAGAEIKNNKVKLDLATTPTQKWAPRRFFFFSPSFHPSLCV